MKRPFGQHFLFDPNILNKIVDCSGVTDEDTVVEIGPGLGRLTGILSERAKKVIAIEFDKRLIERLTDELAERKNVEIVQGDALKFPYEDIKGNFRVVANIPYYITTPIIFKLLEYKEKMPSMTLLMQKEVAKRITASPGTREYGVLSITTRLYTEPVLKFSVSKKAFSPPPKVDSAVLHFKVSSVPRFNIKNEELFLKIVRASFSQRRKTILNGLKKFEGIKDALDKSGIDPRLRAETLGIEDFARLSDALT
ncbi:MAG: 16S rRNA (adenine(1518)-N(6)/adenine(1519)-N(6))-dimethyltransferase RsmA [Thermodesulfovibrionia bacterium]|nr:16S rRNA (adenine(1518)-N(6)/adenine(1519)-N(6))-dimethyltransferase RsmA [Thermodesulfovibrionia bacterium]